MAKRVSRPAAAFLLLVALLAVAVVVRAEKKDPRSKSRKKGQIGCHSCLSEPPTYTVMNHTDLVVKLREGGMTIPVIAKKCHDTLAMMQPDFEGSDLVFCPNTDHNPGACVKLKGLFMGEPFIYRECWSRMWKTPRKYDPLMSEYCYNEQRVQAFVETEENVLCFCEDDLCNAAPSNTLPGHSYLLLLILVASKLLLLRTPHITFAEQL